MKLATLSDGSPLPCGQAALYENFFAATEAHALFDELALEVEWGQEYLSFYGKRIAFPRKTAWYGDAGRSYSFSGITMTPERWTATLLDIKERVEATAGTEFNSVLLNLYRSGSDSISWHSDDEPELGQNPIIASVSFGAARPFHLRYKANPLYKATIELTHGSLLVMSGPMQHCWQHQIPKTKKPLGPRINLTFRYILDKNAAHRTLERRADYPPVTVTLDSEIAQSFPTEEAVNAALRPLIHPPPTKKRRQGEKEQDAR